MYCPRCQKIVITREVPYTKEDEKETAKGWTWQCTECNNFLASSETVEFKK